MKNQVYISKNQDTLLDKFILKKSPLLKFKIKGKSNSSGRNNQGKITSFHKGGGHKRKYRLIDFKRSENSKSIICSIEYDPNRNCNVAATFDIDKKNFTYITAPKNLKIGDIVESGRNVEPKLGNALPIEKISVGSFIHNISSKLDPYAQLSRSAGTFSVIKEKTLDYVVIELSSGEHRMLSPKCYATVGIVSNEYDFLNKRYKAGQSRWLNKRPTVRGVAMNPIDHPHGGGEGKKSGLNKTPWGKFNQRGATSRSKNKNIIKK